MRGRGEPRIWGKGSSLDKRSGQKKQGFRGWFVDGRGWVLRIGERNETAGNTFVLILTTPHSLRSLCFSHTCLPPVASSISAHSPLPAGLVLYPLLRMPAPLVCRAHSILSPEGPLTHPSPMDLPWTSPAHHHPCLFILFFSLVFADHLPRPDIVHTHRRIHLLSVSSIYHVTCREFISLHMAMSLERRIVPGL